MEISILRRRLPWLPWLAAGGLGLAFVSLSTAQNPAARRLNGLGWTVHTTGGNWEIAFAGVPPPESAGALSLIPATDLTVGGRQVESLSGLKNLKNLTSLSLSSTGVTDVSPLGNLKNLTHLNLSSTSVNNVSV